MNKLETEDERSKALADVLLAAWEMNVLARKIAASGANASTADKERYHTELKAIWKLAQVGNHGQCLSPDRWGEFLDGTPITHEEEEHFERCDVCHSFIAPFRGQDYRGVDLSLD